MEKARKCAELEKEEETGNSDQRSASVAQSRRRNERRSAKDVERHSSTDRRQTTRAREAAENEHPEDADRVSEVKRELVLPTATTRSDHRRNASDLDEAVNELNNSEELSKETDLNDSRPSEELCQEQKHSLHTERLPKGLEQCVSHSLSFLIVVIKFLN